MSDHIFIELKQELAATAGISGLLSTSKKLAERINRAARELMGMKDWPGTIDFAVFTVFDPYIVLPPCLKKITHLTVDKVAREIRSPWFEYVQHSTGIIEDKNRADLLLQRNRSPVFRNIPSDGNSWNLKIKAFVDERVSASDPDDCCKTDDGVEPVVNIRGYNGDELIFSNDAGGKFIQGEDLKVSANAGFETTSAKKFTRIISFSKPTTRGRIELYAVRGSIQHLLAIYEPYEKTPSYKAYTYPGFEKDKEQTVLTRARREYVPMIHDNDIVSFGNIEAIRAMMVGQMFMENERLGDYLQWRQTAMSLQVEEEASNELKAKSPPVEVAEGEGNGENEIPAIF